ncbi:MAG: arylsulfatase [Verrucomicrobiaceae bacterium]
MRAFLLGVLVVAQSLVAGERPNVVVMMVDDLGFSDIGCYGGEIETPNLDALAAGGMRFSQFYNTAKCHSSRVSLLTGQYCIAAGDEALTHGVTSAEVLKEAGYFTAMTGKWHLKKEPTDFGFERYFGHLSGATNFFLGDGTFRLNGEKWEVPKEGFYTTVAAVDYALEFLEEARETKKPWYLYVAFNAPHEPLHALPEDYAKYKGRYTEGWDVVREARIAKQKKLGILDEGLTPSPRPEHVAAWAGMEPWKRDYEANRMVTLAAMIDRVDQEVGRLVADLKKNGEFENTLILFVSDNGACPYDRRTPLLNVEPTNGSVFLGDSTGWSWARNSPFRFYKQNQYEGGISTPAIVHWPKGLKVAKGGIVHEPAHLIDVLPTLAEVTGSEIPKAWEGRELRAVSGVSLKPILDGGSLGERGPLHFLFAKDRGLREGDWKLVSFQSEAWELYNLADDRAETNDLAAQEPERLEKMVATWTAMAKDVLHAQPQAYAPVKESGPPHRHPEWTFFEAKTPEEYLRKGGVKRKKAKGPVGIRARKNTVLKVVGDELRLRFDGEDPGIAMDLRGSDLAGGPYRLEFQLVSETASQGEVFFTTSAQTILPKGMNVIFPVQTGKRPSLVTVPLRTKERLHQLRLDLGDGPGSAVISKLRLLSEEGKVLMAWPQK